MKFHNFGYPLDVRNNVRYNDYDIKNLVIHK